MTSKAGRMGRVSQPVLPLIPTQARSIGPSAGLLEGPGGGVVFIFGLATVSYGPADEVGRRLAAVQLVATRIATSQEVAAAFGVSGVTLWTWRRDFAAGGVLALARARTGPKGPIKLTASLAGRIARLDAAGATLLKIAALTGVSTATVRVALGRVGAPTRAPVEPSSATDADSPAGSPGHDGADEVVAERPDLVVLAAPAPPVRPGQDAQRPLRRLRRVQGCQLGCRRRWPKMARPAPWWAHRPGPTRPAPSPSRPRLARRSSATSPPRHRGGRSAPPGRR